MINFHNFINENINEAFNFSKEEVLKVAHLIAQAIEKLDKAPTRVHDLEYDKGRGAGFAIQMYADRYSGGSYTVLPNGDVVNSAIGNSFPNAIYAKIGDTDVKKVMKNIQKFESVTNEAFVGPFVFNDKMSDDELKAMYNGALDGYSYYTKGMQYPKSDYKKAYQEIEKILNKRGVNLNEANNLLKQDTLSPAEYQKAKKLKGFDPKNYKWDKNQDLYLIQKMNESAVNEGQFSWMAQDTGNQIGSEKQNTITITMFDDKGNKWEEKKYDGYGEFGGKDYYELLAQMNGIENPNRQDGIDIAFDKKKVKGKVLFPALIEDPKRFNFKKHDFTQEAEHDPNQSWYQEEEYDDYEEYDESKVTEAASVPSNVLNFAKRKGSYATSLVKKAATWAEKAGKYISGGTAIGKDYMTIILDMKHQGSEIYINLNDETIELFGEEVTDAKSFQKVLDANMSESVVNEGTLKISGPAYDWWNDRDIQKKLNNIKIRIVGDIGGVLTIAGSDEELQKVKDILGISESIVTEGKKIILKRRYTENHPAITVGRDAKIRNKMLEAIGNDGKITQEEFDSILKELSNSGKRWSQNNSKYFNVSEEGISLSKFGKRALQSITVNEEQPETNDRPLEMKVNETRDPKSIRKEYDDLKKVSVQDLRNMWSRTYRVGNPKELDKEGLVMDILVAKHGAKYIDASFEALTEKTTKNPEIWVPGAFDKELSKMPNSQITYDVVKDLAKKHKVFLEDAIKYVEYGWDLDLQENMKTNMKTQFIYESFNDFVENEIINEAVVNEKIKVTKDEWPYMEFKVGGKKHKVQFDYEHVIDDHGNEGQDQYWIGKDEDGQEWSIDVYADYRGEVQDVLYDTLVKESVVTESITKKDIKVKK